MSARGGPEPPFIGAVYEATRSRSGRRWEVWRRDERWGWHLAPMGAASTSGGGVKWIWRTTEDLRDRKRWRFVGVTAKIMLTSPPVDGREAR